jgi:hypothetical protein
MSREKYLDLMEQLGKEPIEEELPPDFDDFPEIVIDAVSTFNMLGDRVYPEIGYVGKDYTNLNVYMDLYQIEDKGFFLELLHWLDSRAIKKSSDQVKREYEKLKRKSSGKHS